jgi:serine phosphatase RsbU (regulator of sigma subunit)/anti-sigma regulatory factor (Ser/Thr protein kinase)
MFGAKPKGAPEPAAPAFRRGTVGIRWIVTVAALAITTGAAVVVGTMDERSARRALTAEVEARLLLEARNLAQAAAPTLLSEFPELTLHPLIRGIQDEQDELALLVVTDHEGRIQGHTDSRQLGTPFMPPFGLAAEPTAHPLETAEQLLGNRELLVVISPIRQGQGRTLGQVVVGLRREYVDDLIARARRQTLAVVGGTLLLATAVTFALMTWLLRSVNTLRAGLERIGRGKLDTVLDVRDRTELGMLARTVNAMTSELREAQHMMVEKERLAHELDLARQIQHSLLPAAPIREGAFRVEGTQHPAAEVGGDYYDYFHLADGRIGLAIADVSGKGLAGCMITSMLSALLRAYKDDHASPSGLLGALDEKLSFSLAPGTFVTMFYGILDPRTGALTYASAAHCPTLVFRKRTRQVDLELPTGIPLGAIRGGAIRGTLKDVTVQLEPGDMVVQYTDGVNEAFDPSRKEQFGFDRLREILAASGAEGWSALQHKLDHALTAWRRESIREDDETLLVVTRAVNGDAVSSYESEAAPAPKEPVLAELELCARLEELRGIRPWLLGSDGLASLEPEAFEILHSALYETCANIVEHGYGNAGEHRIRLERLPSREGPPGAGSPPTERFLVHDHGEPFRADNWEKSDFADRSVRRQGRGFGLDIIHQAMVRVEYRPSALEGNVTALEFNPSKLPGERRRYA